MSLLIANIPTIICVGLAGCMALQGIGSWGWFLLIGLMLAHTTKSEERK